MKDIFDYLQANRREREQQLEAYLSIPSVSSDPTQTANIARCADFTADLLKQAGIEKVQIHPTPGHPLVSGFSKQDPNRPTLLIYGHYDVQPVDPLELWDQDPFFPHYQNDRIVARGAADDKGQLLMHIQAVEAIHKTRKNLPINLIFLIEGEEEIGSPHLSAFLEANKTQFTAEVALVSDSSMWAENQPAITSTLRGLVLLDVTVTGPNRDLHSGSFGGAVANPLEILCHILSSVKDRDGTIQIPGFYDRVRPLSKHNRQHLSQLPFDPENYLKNIGLTHGWGEKDHTLLERIWLRPTFEINGMWGGYSGPGAKTVLPSKAHAKLSLRLVLDQDPDEMADLVTRFLVDNAPPQVSIEVNRISGGGHGVSVATDTPPMQAARRALLESFHQEPLIIGEGGSIPVIADFEKLLNTPTLLLGFSLPDAKPHAPNENLHLPTFHTGIESLVRLLYYLS